MNITRRKFWPNSNKELKSNGLREKIMWFLSSGKQNYRQGIMPYNFLSFFSYLICLYNEYLKKQLGKRGGTLMIICYFAWEHILCIIILKLPFPGIRHRTICGESLRLSAI